MFLRSVLLRGERLEACRPREKQRSQRAPQVLCSLRLQQETSGPSLETTRWSRRRKTRDMGLPRNFRLQTRRKVTHLMSVCSMRSLSKKMQFSLSIRRCLVFDLDSDLPFPTFFHKYVTETFRTDAILNPEYHRFFRVVPAGRFLQVPTLDQYSLH